MAKRMDESNPQGLIGKDLTLVHAALSGGVPVPASPGALLATTSRVAVAYHIVGIIERETGPFGGTAAVSGLMIPLGRARAIASATRALTQALVPERAAECGV